MTGFRTESRRLDRGAYVISPTGELGVQAASEFEEAIFALIAGGGKRIVVDLSGVSFIDATAIEILVRGERRLRPGGGRMALVCRDRNIARVFEVTGLGQIFALHESLTSALADVGNGSAG